MFTKYIRVIAACLLGVCITTNMAHAVHFVELQCDDIPTTNATSYDVKVTCYVTINRPGSSGWQNAVGQYCPTFCASQNAANIASPDGFACTSGEERPLSAIGKVDFSRTGCWHSCSQPEGIAGAVSVGGRCYAPGQRQDNDPTDLTMGCFCANGDVGSHTVELGIHASGVASVSGLSSKLKGWERVDRSLKNDKAGRMFDVIGAVPLGQSSDVAMVLNVKGACGTGVQMSGAISHPDKKLVQSDTISIPLPACPTECNDGIDNDGDGAADEDDFGCDGPSDNNESDPLSKCQNGLDDDGDGLVDSKDPGCTSPQDNDEENVRPKCDNDIDDDGDGLIDLLDPGCSNKTDEDESNPPPKCDNGIDDDCDGLIDLLDPGCSNSKDDDETNEGSQFLDKLTPIAECIDVLQNGTLVAHFGYRNDNSTKVSVPTGEDNKLSPGAQDRGQPTSFETGRISDSFSVSFQDTSAISWKIGKNSASASIATKRCQGDEACIDTNIKPLLAALDNLSRQQKANVYVISNRIIKLDKSDALTTKAQGYKTQAHKLYVEQWTDIWSSFDQISRACAECSQIDKSADIQALLSRSRKLLRLSRKASASLKTARNGKVTSADQDAYNTASSLFDRFSDKTADLPRFESDCN